MDKPISLSVKDYIIRKMSVKLMMSEETLNAIVSHQFQSANEAMSKHHSVELSGFGKLYFNMPKAVKKLNTMLAQKAALERQLLDPECIGRRREIVVTKLKNMGESIEILKPMLEYETVRNLRGLEEQNSAPRTLEGTDSGSSEGTTEDL